MRNMASVAPGGRKGNVAAAMRSNKQRDGPKFLKSCEGAHSRFLLIWLR